MMKKLLMIVGAMLAFNTAHALDLDWQNDVTVSPATLEGNQTFTIGADQDGNKFSIGSHGITLSISDTVDILNGIKLALSSKFSKRIKNLTNPYESNISTKKIVSFILNLKINDKLLRKKFIDKK